MLLVECPSCRTKFETLPEFAGKTVVCAKCSQTVNVPKDAAAITASPPKPAPLPGGKGPEDPKTPQSIAKGNNTALRNGILIAVGIAVIGFAIFAIFFSSTQGANPVVVIETSMGTITAELYQDKAPITVDNFMIYVDKKHYDGLIFHRVIRDFMIQGGGFTQSMQERKTGASIKNESYNGLANKKGTLAMARTSAPDSATSQFFINTVDNKFLDRANAQDKVGYAVFGRVIDGMDIVEKIRGVETHNLGGHENVPIEPVIIKSIRRTESK